jgi:hypothetical protein
MDKETKLVKDRECIKCEKFFDCKGKPQKTRCILFTPRKTNEEGKV